MKLERVVSCYWMLRIKPASSEREQTALLITGLFDHSLDSNFKKKKKNHLLKETARIVIVINLITDNNFKSLFIRTARL